MYKMSEVCYKLNNGTIVDTLEKAKSSGLKFTKIYRPIEEDFFNDTESRAWMKRRSIA